MNDKDNTARIMNLADYNIGIKHNGELLISLGKSRFETAWKNKRILWSSLLARLSKSVETPETHAEYMKMSKEQQDRIKDIGGFVGGHLENGRRKTGSVLARQILTLDLDFPPADFWDTLMNNLEINSALAVYSTHKHSAGTPRFRLIMPLDREVTPDEYEAIARKIAEKVGIDLFDDSTFQPTRLMYWPSNSTGVEPFFNYYDAPFLSADAVLAEYPDWTDTSYWPESSRMTGIRKRQADKQGDPLEKKGMTEETRAQIWAEAMAYTAEGEDSFLDAEMEKEAAKAQQAALEYDDREGQVLEYLETLLPDDWYSWDTNKRVDYFMNRDALAPKIDATMQRKQVCAVEIFCECFGRPRNAWKKSDGYEIANIMARIQGWERTGKRARIEGYGQQRPYSRKLSQ